MKELGDYHLGRACRLRSEIEETTSLESSSIDLRSPQTANALKKLSYYMPDTCDVEPPHPFTYFVFLTKSLRKRRTEACRSATVSNNYLSQILTNEMDDVDSTDDGGTDREENESANNSSIWMRVMCVDHNYDRKATGVFFKRKTKIVWKQVKDRAGAFRAYLLKYDD